MNHNGFYGHQEWLVELLMTKPANFGIEEVSSGVTK